jgi:hypothetical protein
MITTVTEINGGRDIFEAPDLRVFRAPLTLLDACPTRNNQRCATDDMRCWSRRHDSSAVQPSVRSLGKVPSKH